MLGQAKRPNFSKKTRSGGCIIIKEEVNRKVLGQPRKSNLFSKIWCI